MQSFMKTTPARATFAVAALGAVFCLSGQVFSAASFGHAKVANAAPSVVAARPAAAPAVAATPAPATAVVATAAPAAKPLSAAAVRSMMKFETVRWGGKPVRTLDDASRLMLARAAAEKAGLGEVGLTYRDVYGVIEAETSWIPRTGSSKDGTPNLGLAQLEPRTARGLGVSDPGDPVQAVFAAAMYMKQGAEWASGRIAPLKSRPALYAAKLREGVSIHYNLSIKGRNKWNGLNTAQLPVETQRHIRNAFAGAQEAAQLERRLSA
jgi:hypothetical protein